MTKFSALQLRKAGGKAGHQATQFTGALVVFVVVMVKVVKTLMVMMLGGNDGGGESINLTVLLRL